MKRQFELIYACGYNGEIGHNNDLLWRLPRDMRHFVSTTKGGQVFMGRKTYESLPESLAALPKRANFVITSNPKKVAEEYGWRVSKKIAKLTDGESYVSNHLFFAESSIEDAFNKSNLTNEVGDYGAEKKFIIGGARLYQSALDQELVNTVHRTVVHESFPLADTKWNPDLRAKGFRIIESKHYSPDMDNEYGVTIEKWIYNPIIVAGKGATKRQNPISPDSD